MVAKRKSSEMKVSVLAQMVLPKRSLYRYEKCRASYSGKRSCGDRSLGIATGVFLNSQWQYRAQYGRASGGNRNPSSAEPVDMVALLTLSISQHS